jgi:hypothetical protein
MTDIVERMRAHVANHGGLVEDADGTPIALKVPAWAMMLEAADEIERIRKANDEASVIFGDMLAKQVEAEALLKARACYPDCTECDDGDHDTTWCGAAERAYFEKHKEPA